MTAKNYTANHCCRNVHRPRSKPWSRTSSRTPLPPPPHHCLTLFLTSRALPLLFTSPRPRALPSLLHSKVRSETTKDTAAMLAALTVASLAHTTCVQIKVGTSAEASPKNADRWGRSWNRVTYQVEGRFYCPPKFNCASYTVAASIAITLFLLTRPLSPPPPSQRKRILCASDRGQPWLWPDHSQRALRPRHEFCRSIVD